MSGEEQRKIAFGYINGTDGLSKDEKRGWETMKQAADLGDAQACLEYADHIVGSGEYAAALGYFAKGDLKGYLAAGNKGHSADAYVEALAKNAAANPATAAFAYSKALEIKDHIMSDGWYWLADLTKRVHPEDRASIIGCLANASINANPYSGSSAPSALFAEYGMEKGVLRNGDEFMRWYKHLPSRYKLHVADLKKGEGMARALAEAALGDDRSKKLGGARIAKMRSLTPAAVLEYQKVCGEMQYIGEYSYGFRHQASNSITYTTGSGTCNIDTWYANYSALYKNSIKNDDLNGWINNLDYTDDMPKAEARVRVNVEREREVKKGLMDRHISAYDIIKGRVAQKYNWYKSDITLNNVENISDYVPSEDDITLIPFWFLHYKLDGETVTARVNGCTGEVDFFINNPYAQFTDKDDVTVNGGAEASRGGADGKSGGRKKFSVGSFLALSIILPVVGGIIYIVNYLRSK